MSFITTAASVTKALPNAASTSASTDGIATGSGVAAGGELQGNHEFVLSIPSLNGTQLPAAKTVTYVVEHDTASSFGTVATLIPVIATQTGTAVTGGAAAQTVLFRLPSNTKPFVRVTATTGADTGDCSAKSVTLAFNL